METDSRSATNLSASVGKEIRKLLIDLDLKQAELAARLGENEMWMSRRLRGTQPIDLNDLERIAKALDVEVSALFPQREGRVVTHAGAPRRQTTVPKIGSLTALAKRGTTGRPHGRTSALPPIADSGRRVSRVMANAA
jgi:transcriptional regulator with XRE-family HTH domain